MKVHNVKLFSEEEVTIVKKIISSLDIKENSFVQSLDLVNIDANYHYFLKEKYLIFVF